MLMRPIVTLLLPASAGTAFGASWPSVVQVGGAATPRKNVVQLTPTPRLRPFDRLFVPPGRRTSVGTLPRPQTGAGDRWSGERFH